MLGLASVYWEIKEAHVRVHQVEGMGLYPRLARKAIVQSQEGNFNQGRCTSHIHI
jgi:hypothetical protein